MSTKIDANTTICPICGGVLKSHGYGQKICSSCNQVFATDYKGMDDFDRANNLMKNNAFYEAGEIYRDLLSKDSNFVEANWGALLCRFGIEYVEENGKEIPTIHRPITNFKIDECSYAKKIIENTVGDENDKYIAKIAELEELRTEIEEHTPKIKYDVFISCKITENSNDNAKTREYKWAKEVYLKLSNLGLKVFFSPESLPATNGPYEPIIYSALQSAKYLIVLASTKEHLNSRWIKNEWGRFIELKRESKNEKAFKLIIDTKTLKQSDIDDRLAVETYIDRNESRWMEHTITAVVSHCGVDGGIVDTGGIDLDKIAKIRDKELLGSEITILNNDDDRIIVNPYKDMTMKDYAQDDVVDNATLRCTTVVEAKLTSGNIKGAEKELNDYFEVYGSKNEELNYHILKMKLLLASGSESVDDFFANKISSFEDFELFKIMINKMPKTEENIIIVPLIDYIIKSIKGAKDNNALEMYKTIVDINSEMIKKLNLRVLSLLKCLLGNSNLLLRYFDVCGPYVSIYSLRDYMDKANTIARDLCSKNDFTAAKMVMDKIYAIDSQDGSLQLTKLYVEKKATNQNELVEKIESENDFIAVEEMIKHLSRDFVFVFVDGIKNRILELISREQFKRAYGWINIIAKIGFDERIEFFKTVVIRCYEHPESYDLFNVAINSMDQDNKDFYVQYQLKFIKRLLKNKKFEQAKANCAKLNMYDTKNIQALKYEIYAETETSDFSYKKIYKLEKLELIEKMLLVQNTQYYRDKILSDFYNNCILYFDNADSCDENVFTVFNKLISYSSKDITFRDSILKFGNLCLEKKMFDYAEWYFKRAIILSGVCDEAYWGIILAKLKCRNNDDVIKCPTRVTQMEEYQMIIKCLLGDKNTLRKYEEIAFAQDEYSSKEKKQKNGKRIIIGSVISALILIGVITVTVCLI